MILLNGKRFLCRSNLADFLDMAQSKYSGRGDCFWIDAICIDQPNFQERNHQVAQMGDIYSHATAVTIWLGRDDRAVRFVRFLVRLTSEERFGNNVHTVFGQEWSQQLREGCLAFWSNAYWTRAWITQEIFLAKSAHVVINELEAGRSELRTLASLFPHMGSSVAGSRHSSKIRMLEMYAHAMADDEGFYLRGRRLIDLLDHFPLRESRIARDRFYSLRAIAEDGETIPVDYESPDDEVLERLCHTLEKSLCFCSVAHVGHVLGLQPSVNEPGLSTSLRLSLPLARATLLPMSRTVPEKAIREVMCNDCKCSFDLDEDKQFFCCLNRVCRYNWSTHLILPKTSMSVSGRTKIKAFCNNGSCYDLEIMSYQLNDCYDRRESHVNINIHLRSFLQIALSIMKDRNMICTKAVNGRTGKTEVRFL